MFLVEFGELRSEVAVCKESIFCNGCGVSVCQWKHHQSTVAHELEDVSPAFGHDLVEGAEEAVSVKVGNRICYPDLVLTRKVGARRLYGVVEVETAESVNRLEAMSEWIHYGRARGAFYLYVPAGFTDVALRLCENSRINVTEIWAYYAFGSQAKFSMVYRSKRATSLAKVAKKKVSLKNAEKSAAVKQRKVAKNKSKVTKGRKTTRNKLVKKASTKTRRVTKTKNVRKKSHSTTAGRKK